MFDEIWIFVFSVINLCHQKFIYMAKIEKSLSKKENIDGRRQIMLRFLFGHACVFRMKSGISVKEDMFDLEKEDIIIPTNNRYNQERFYEASRAKAELDYLINRVMSIAAAGTPDGQPLTKEWIRYVLSLQDNDAISLDINGLTLLKIENAMRIDKILKDEEKKAREAEEKEKAKVKTELPNAIDFFLSHQKLCQGRVYAYRVLRAMVERFTMYKRETEDDSFTMYIDSVTVEDLEEFREYIRNESILADANKRIFNKILTAHPVCSNPNHSRKLEVRGENYIISVMKRMRAVFNFYIRHGLTQNNPLARFDMGLEIYGLPIYITKEERDQIADFDLSSAPLHVQQQRDIFVFQCLTGCRVGDLMKLTAANISHGILEYVPSKTKDRRQQVMPRVPLSSRALALVEKYKGVDSSGRLFPFITPQKYNENIRVVFKLCGMNRNVIVRNSATGRNELKPIWEVATSHMARRTFVGAAYKAVKDPNLIGAMSGHVPGSKAFSRYRRIDDEDLKIVISAMSD